MSERLRARPTFEDPITNRPPQKPRLPENRSEAEMAAVARSLCGVSLDTILARIHGLPALSSVVVRALQMTENQTSSAREIAAVINEDHRFSARVVKAANTACSGLPRTINSVNDAVLVLGTESFREIVLMAAVRDLLHRPLPGYGTSADEMWRHSLACAFAAKIVAEMTGYSNCTEAFVAGLLHDVGKIVLDEEMQKAGGVISKVMPRHECTFLDAERLILGFDHCDTGGRILRSWGIPQHIVQAVALHRKPVVSRQTVPLAGYIHLGEILCGFAGIGVEFEGSTLAIEPKVLADFKLTDTDIDRALGRLVDTVNASQALFSPPNGDATR